MSKQQGTVLALSTSRFRRLATSNIVKLPTSDAWNCSCPLYLEMNNFIRRLIVDECNISVMISATCMLLLKSNSKQSKPNT